MNLRHHSVDWSLPSPPGTWDYLPARPESTVTAFDFAVITCPQGHSFRLVSTKHQVAGDGTVRPSVVCPHGCSFHDFVRLVGWDPIELCSCGHGRAAHNRFVSQSVRLACSACRCTSFWANEHDPYPV